MHSVRFNSKPRKPLSGINLDITICIFHITDRLRGHYIRPKRQVYEHCLSFTPSAMVVGIAYSANIEIIGISKRNSM